MEQLVDVNPKVEKTLTDSIKELYQHPDTQLVHRERHGKPNDEILQALRNDISKDGKLMNPSAWIERAPSEDAVPGRHEKVVPFQTRVIVTKSQKLSLPQGPASVCAQEVLNVTLGLEGRRCGR